MERTSRCISSLSTSSFSHMYSPVLVPQRCAVTNITYCFFRMATITSFTGLCILMPELVNAIFIGRCGSVEQLGAVGLGNSMQNCLALSVAVGFGTAFDTLTSTCCGAGESRLAMMYLARGRIAVTLVFFLLAPVLWYTDHILVALYQPPRIARYANDYNRASLLGLWCLFQQCVVRRYLQTRGEPTIVAGTQLYIACSHPFWCYLFVVHWPHGNGGVGVANAISWISGWLILECYMRWRRVELGIECPAWFSFYLTREAWSGMRAYFGVALPSALLKWVVWSWGEILTILAGLCGPMMLAAHVAVYNILSVCLVTSIGMGATTSYFVGSALGRCDARCARIATRLSVWLSLLFSLSVALVTFTWASDMASLFALEPSVLAYMVSLFYVFALNYIPLAVQEVLCTVLRVCGSQHLALGIVVVQNFVVSCSLSVLFGFVWHGGVYGMWWASVIAASGGTLVCAFLVYHIDMDNEIQKASARILRDGREPLLRSLT